MYAENKWSVLTKPDKSIINSSLNVSIELGEWQLQYHAIFDNITYKHIRDSSLRWFKDGGNRSARQYMLDYYYTHAYKVLQYFCINSDWCIQ